MSNEGPLPPAHVQIKHGCTMRMDGVRLAGRRNGYTKIGEGLLSSGECVLQWDTFAICMRCFRSIDFTQSLVCLISPSYAIKDSVKIPSNL